MRHLNVNSLHLVHVGGISSSSQPRGRYLKEVIGEKARCPVVFIETFEAWEKHQSGHIVIEFESEKGVDRFLRIEQDWLEETFRSRPITFVKGLLKKSERADFFGEIHARVGVDLLRHDGKPPSQWSSAVELRKALTPARKRPHPESHFTESRQSVAGSSTGHRSNRYEVEGRGCHTTVKRSRSRPPAGDATPIGGSGWRTDARRRTSYRDLDSTPPRDKEAGREASNLPQSVRRSGRHENVRRSPVRTDTIPPPVTIPTPTAAPVVSGRHRSLASFGSKARMETDTFPPPLPSHRDRAPTSTPVPNRRRHNLASFGSKGAAESGGGVVMDLIDLELLDTTEESPEQATTAQLGGDCISAPTTTINPTAKAPGKEPCTHSWVCSKCGEHSSPIPALPDCQMEVDVEKKSDGEEEDDDVQLISQWKD